MPELPDLETYLAALEARTLGTRLERIRLTSPFLRRLGKRLVFDLDEDLFLVLHLMIAGRLRWKSLGTAPPQKSGLASFWPTGCCRGYSSRAGQRVSTSSNS